MEATDESMDDVEAPRSCQALCVSPHTWTQLPIRFWEKVLEYLDCRDRWSMSQTLNIWKELVMKPPDLWRSVVFRFPRHQLVGANGNLVYIRRFGVYMRHVTISYRRPTYSNRRKIVREISEVLHELSVHASLTSFKMQRLTLHHKWISDRARKNLVNSATSFLINQAKLKRVDLSNSNCHRWEATYILHFLSRRNASTLEELYLKNFLETKLELINFPDYESLIHHMPNLRILSVNCSSINATLLIAMARGWKSLEHLIVNCRRKDYPRMQFPEELWNDFTFRMPRLQLHFSFEKVHRLKAIFKALPKGVPLHSFSYEGDTIVPIDSGNHLPKFLKELATHLSQNFSHTLEVVELDLGTIPSHTLPLALDILVARLPMLKVLRVKALMTSEEWSDVIYNCYVNLLEIERRCDAFEIDDGKIGDVTFVRRCIRHKQQTWSDLTYENLVSIFKHMTVDDRIAASQTCAKWRNVIKDSQPLWTTIVMSFPEKKSGRTAKVIEEFYKVIESVDLNTSDDYLDKYKMKLEVTAALLELKKCKNLKHLRASCMTIYPNNPEERCRRMVVLHYVQLIGSCSPLQTINFSNSFCVHWEASALTFHFNRQHKEHLKTLNLINFLAHKVPEGTINDLRSVISGMTVLQVFKANVWLLRAEMLQPLKNLQELYIHLEDGDPINNAISARQWEEIRKSSKKLKVHFTAKYVSGAEAICTSLPKGVPLHSFSYKGDTMVPIDSGNHPPTFLKELATHLSQNFSHTLEVVELDLGTIASHTLPLALDILVARLPMLKVLRVKALMTSEEWSDVIYNCYDNLIELKELSCGIVDGSVMVGAESLQMAFASYSHFFESRGVAFSYRDV